MSGVGGVAGAHEGSYLLREGERLAVEPNETTEKLRTLGNAVLMGAFYALGASLAGFRDGWSVLGTTLATSTGVFAFSRLNMEEWTRKATFFMVAGVTYELFLGLFTTAGANSGSQICQYLPLIALMVGGATWLELSTQGLSKAWSQIKAPKAAQVQRDTPPRFGIYPVTRQTVRYCAVQLLPAVGGAILVGLGARNSGASKFLMESSGIRLLAASAGRVAQNLFANLALVPSLIADEDNDQPHSTKSKRLIALNEGLQQIATFAAPATYAVALTTNILPVEIATGFLNGMLDAEGQRKLEEDGLRPPNRLSVEQKKVVNRVAIAVSVVFVGLMAYYLISTAYKTDKNPAVDHPATWGVTGGILGTTALTFGFTKLIQYSWKNADTRGALVWLSRWFGAENTRWLAYLNGDFVHVRNMRGVTVSLGVVLTGLILTGATIGFDLALLNDDRLVCLKLSAFAWVMLMRYTVTVPGTFPMHAANATLSAVAGKYGEL